MIFVEESGIEEIIKENKRNENNHKFKSPIRSKRFEINQNPIGRGCWGIVYPAKDMCLEQEVVVKDILPTELAEKQTKERNIDLLRETQKEAGKLSACANVVPRRLEFDDNGKPFIVMPFYSRFLSDVIRDNELFLINTYEKQGLETILKYATGIANGLSEMHNKNQIGRAHGDLKPDNIAIDLEGNALINDLGSSTCVTLGSPDPRDNIGFVYTRAPECFKEKSHPTYRSDVWAFGALLYRMLSKSGKYPLQEEIDEAIEEGKNPDEKIGIMSGNDLNKILKSKIRKNIPIRFQGIIRKCLEPQSFNRYDSGKELKENLEKRIESLNYWKNIRKKIPTWSAIAVPLISVGLLFNSIAKYEPKDLTLPKPQIQGPIYLEKPSIEPKIEFDVEEIKNLPKPYYSAGDGMDVMIKRCTKNRNVAALLKTYHQTLEQSGLLYCDVYTQDQLNMYMVYCPETREGLSRRPLEFMVPATSIEIGLTKAQKENGEVDLEDTLTIARVGESTTYRAMRLSGSYEFKNYLIAKDSKGEYIIPKKEQNFLKLWLSNTHKIME